MVTVSDAFYGVLRQHGVSAVFGNPGSNELSFLTGLPDDIPYYLALQPSVWPTPTPRAGTSRCPP
ncbi:thiamine pyrophosphate-binding protein [Streptomyces sp. NPDC002769]|uniref:thiamine pyrophosphate-binding protein n=1 Tax=Streptomyces sp. NPDC002769 TaxID=3154542 RepID=UPI003318AB47